MTLSRDHARRVVDTYLEAWRTQDPDLIVSLFTPSAVYHERVLEEPITTRAGIRRYWQDKVVAGQGRIECRLLALYVDGSTAIAEWEACFDDHEDGLRKRMHEVAILEFDGPLIARLREYWSSEPLGPIVG